VLARKFILSRPRSGARAQAHQTNPLVTAHPAFQGMSALGQKRTSECECSLNAKSGHPSTRWPYQDRLLGLAPTGQSLTFRHIEFVLVVSRFELE
jgi:hypothetical protein